MDAKTCLEKLRLVGVLSFATVDDSGSPQIRCISAIHFDDQSFYFFTARGKNFCRELLADGRVQILSYTRFKEMIRLSAKAVRQRQWKGWDNCEPFGKTVVFNKIYAVRRSGL